jgi:hypothetical protein
MRFMMACRKRFELKSQKKTNGTYRDKNCMLRCTLFIQRFTETTNSDTASFPNIRIWVLQTSLDERPDLLHARTHEFTAALNGHAE